VFSYGEADIIGVGDHGLGVPLEHELLEVLEVAVQVWNALGIKLQTILLSMRKAEHEKEQTLYLRLMGKTMTPTTRYSVFSGVSETGWYWTLMR